MAKKSDKTSESESQESIPAKKIEQESYISHFTPKHYYGGKLDYDIITKGFKNMVDATSGSKMMIDFQNALARSVGSTLAKEYILDQSYSNNQIKLTEDETNLKVEINKLRNTLSKKEEDQENLQEKLWELNSKIEELQEISKKRHVISRVSEYAEGKISSSPEFYLNFEDGKVEDAVVISIDIRRSTELMLKARTPKLFSEFITGLSFLLSECIKANLGIFDKFTGDGILAFFPKFYSGEQAIIRALKAAEECHNLFIAHYNNSKSSFNVFIKDVGLGIGIDYGNVTLVNTSSELTVVGIPVVYACRFSGSNAGDTLLNVPAKEEMERLCADHTTFTETELYIKNEGNALAYKAIINSSVYKNLQLPSWLNEELKAQENEDKVESSELPND